jgi:hypothetical protein
MDIRFFFWKGTYFLRNFLSLYLVDAGFGLPAALNPGLVGNLQRIPAIPRDSSPLN